MEFDTRTTRYILSIGMRTYMLKRVAEVWERWRKCASRNCSNDVLQLLRISKSKKTWDGELHILFVLGRIPQILQPWYHRSLFSLYLCLSLSLSLSLSLFLSVFPSIVNPTRTCGWIPACPRSQGPLRRNYERDENWERRDRMCFTFIIFSFPTNTSTSARNNINNKRNGL